MNIFLTGVSSGIGLGLAKHYLCKGATVYGVSRRSPDIDHSNFRFLSLDLLDYKLVAREIPAFLKDAPLNLAVLNAGVLGKIQPMLEASLDELKATMETNLWSQKVLLDELLKASPPKTAVAISSGAGVRGNFGWSGYSLSKAALNMLIQLYAQEFPETSFYALAPGLVQTGMQETLSKVSSKEFSSVQKLHDAWGTDNMPKPEAFAPKFERALEQLRKLESGSFADLRQMGV